MNLSKKLKSGMGYDEFGNPEGEAYDLGGMDDERLQGERILLYVGYGVPGLHGEKYEWHQVKDAVSQRNLEMDILYATSDSDCALDEKTLQGYSQLWFVSNQYVTLNNKQVKFICDFVEAGNGLLIWADNEPYYADANLLAKQLIGTEFSGNKMADQILIPGGKLKSGCFVEHPLTQGINQLYEGITISTIHPAQNLTILAQSHDGQNCMACFEKGKQRIVLDTGFTKLYADRFYRTAGTARYFRNIAFWLARGARGYEYVQFTPGREQIATVNPQALSECYAYNVKMLGTLTYILFWQGQAELGLEIKDPQGALIGELSSANSPIRLEVPATTPGTWQCWVKGVNVPHNDFPYVLTLAVNTGASEVVVQTQNASQGENVPTALSLDQMPALDWGETPQSKPEIPAPSLDDLENLDW